jgi:psiF repeat-containing protein
MRRPTGFIHVGFILAAQACASFLTPIGVSMMTISSRVAAAAFASLLLASPAFAQGTAAPAAAEPAAKAAKSEKARSPESLDCSKQADEKGLHGKARKKFRSDCIKEAKAKK